MMAICWSLIGKMLIMHFFKDNMFDMVEIKVKYKQKVKVKNWCENLKWKVKV